MIQQLRLAAGGSGHAPLPRPGPPGCVDAKRAALPFGRIALHFRFTENMPIERTIKMRNRPETPAPCDGPRRRRFAGSAILAAMLAGGLLAQVRSAPPAQLPDERYKADILVIVAHPDDERRHRLSRESHLRRAPARGGHLRDARQRRGNAAGNEQAASLAAVREIEARRALAYFGVMNVWFLNGPDTPGQDVLRSLETWNHGASLEQVVRLVRLTRRK